METDRAESCTALPRPAGPELRLMNGPPRHDAGPAEDRSRRRSRAGGGPRPGPRPVEALVDITKVDELIATDMSGDIMTLGAGVTHTQIVENPAIRDHATCLAESCGVVGGPQVRNVATIGGNVAHALPAADGTLK